MLERLSSLMIAWFAGRPRRPPPGDDGRGRLAAVLEAPGGRGASTATALARSLAGRSPGPVLLADLTLDAPHRRLHGIAPGAPGLAELAAACRFGPPAPTVLTGTTHRTSGGFDLLPGLRRHQDWVTIGARSAATLVATLTAAHAIVLAHVDRDLEGEGETGSFDVEDRNVLARTAVRAADLVIVVGDVDRAGRQALLATCDALARFGVPPTRTLVVATGIPWPLGRRATNLGGAVSDAIERAGSPTPPDVSDDPPQRITPGGLGR
ncbi:MAG: hypothetical protein ACTHN0_04055 [Aquihabitans sp.]